MQLGASRIFKFLNGTCTLSRKKIKLASTCKIDMCTVGRAFQYTLTITNPNLGCRLPWKLMHYKYLKSMMLVAILSVPARALSPTVLPAPTTSTPRHSYQAILLLKGVEGTTHPHALIESKCINIDNLSIDIHRIQQVRYASVTSRSMISLLSS